MSAEVKPGYKMTEAGVIPDDWEVATIAETMKLINGRAFKPSEWTDFGLPIIRIQNLNDADAVFNLFSGVTDERNRVRKGDLLFAWSGTLGSSFGARIWRGPEGVLNQHIFKVVPDQRKISPEYAYVVFSGIESEIAKRAHGFKTSFVHVKKSDLDSMCLPVPCIEEQHSIALALSEMDTLISGLDQLIAKKRDIKQAAMQQLLTGQKRLPGFSGEWEEKQLGDLALLLKGADLSKGDILQDGANKCILYGELFTVYGRVIHRANSRTNSRGGIPSKIGDVLLPGSTTTIGIDLACASALHEEDVLLGGDINIVRPKTSDSFDATFLAYYLTNISAKDIAERAQGITIIHLYGRDLRTLVINLPSIYEQAAIADILSDMDTELAALEARRENALQLKQGMMQELLTGRIRLV